MNIIGVIIGLIFITFILSIYVYALYRAIKEKLFGMVFIMTAGIWMPILFWSLDCVRKFLS